MMFTTGDNYNRLQHIFIRVDFGVHNMFNNLYCYSTIKCLGVNLSVQEEDNIHMPKSKRVKRAHVAFIDDW